MIGERCVLIHNSVEPLRQVFTRLTFSLKMFSRPLKLATKSCQWERFYHHGRRIQELDYDYANPGQKIICPDAFIALASTRPEVELVPNLMKLVWVIVDDSHFFYVSLFMHKGLKRLQLIVLPDVTNTALKDFLDIIPERCPELNELDISAGMRISSLEPSLSNALPFS